MSARVSVLAALLLAQVVHTLRCSEGQLNAVTLFGHEDLHIAFKVRGRFGLPALFPHSLQGLPTPVAYYNFDSNSGTSVSPAIGSVTATLVNGAAIVANGVSGNAVSVTRGGNSYVDFGAALWPTGPFSVQAWVKTTDANGALVAFHASYVTAGWFLGMGDFFLDASVYGYIGNDGCNTGSGQVKFWVGNPCSGQSTTVINDGHWHQAVGVFDGSRTYVYLDGALQAQSSGGNSLSTPPAGTHLLVGGVYVYGTAYNTFTGYIDELKIYGQALTATQVQQLFYSELPSASPTPSPSLLSASPSLTSSPSQPPSLTPTASTTPTPSPATVTLTTGPTSISNGQTTNLLATLDAVLGHDVTIYLKPAGTAVRGTDYTIGAAHPVIMIPAGQLSGSLDITCTTTQSLVHLEVYVNTVTTTGAVVTGSTNFGFTLSFAPIVSPSGNSFTPSTTETASPSASTSESFSSSLTRSRSVTRSWSLTRTASRTPSKSTSSSPMP